MFEVHISPSSILDETHQITSVYNIQREFCLDARKRKPLHTYDESKTFNTLTSMVGRGNVSVSAAVDLAGAIVADHEVPHKAIAAFASLGAGTDGVAHPQNQERDLYRWLKNLYNLQLQPYVIDLDLQVYGISTWQHVPCFVQKP